MKTREIDDFHHSWSQHDVFNVIEELSTTPEPWSFENFVSLLLFRPALIPISLTARLEHNYADEACLMFNTFAIVGLHLLQSAAASLCSIANSGSS
ncbi:hypothetical protein ANCDUO_17248 [Ancylostoma duodenale]|uniref:FBXO47 ARM repeats region domain-containing protein n=1 Tax=Ancylostoma duodenale TaxID=51022 RepID=A0A0C2G173_9BILA|nr:hypothetical protein ANCDUO_17248 [Ancylostoma duodenale]